LFSYVESKNSTRDSADLAQWSNATVLQKLEMLGRVEIRKGRIGQQRYFVRFISRPERTTAFNGKLLALPGFLIVIALSSRSVAVNARRQKIRPFISQPPISWVFDLFAINKHRYYLSCIVFYSSFWSVMLNIARLIRGKGAFAIGTLAVEQL